MKKPTIAQASSDARQMERLRQLYEKRGIKREVFATRDAAYAQDPVGWTEAVLGEFLWSKQKEIFEKVRDNRQVAIRSCHNIGKSFSAARLMAWWVAVHPIDDVFIVSTAPSGAQVRAILWRELRSAAAKGKLPGTVQTTQWVVGDRLVGFGRKPNDYEPDAFQGIHARFVLVILDEANGIPQALWTAASTLAAGATCRIVAIGNPDDPTSEFSTVSKPGSGWETIQIGYEDTPNFSGEEVPEDIRSRLISPEWVEEQKKRLGEASPIYISKVLGEFPEQSEDSLIPVAHVRAAQERTLEPDDTIHTLGVDVARFGSDKTIIVERRGRHARVISVTVQEDTMQTAGRVIQCLGNTGASIAAIDTVGVGAGVYDRLVEQGQPVMEMQAGQSAFDNEHLANKRAEWFWGLRQRFEDGDIDIDPTDDELASQLLSIKYKPNSRGQILLESKDDMKKRGMPSPDRADALAMAFATWDMTWTQVYNEESVEAEGDEGKPNPWADVYS